MRRRGKSLADEAADNKAGDPLRLYWWKAVPNFGDALSAKVVEHVSGRAVVHGGPGVCDLFAIGSVLQVARRNLKSARADGTRPWVWGSGLLNAVPTNFLTHLDIALVRGPVTAALLGLETDQFGDPGLLVTDALAPPPPRADHIGIVPHHRHVDDPDLHALVAATPQLRLIDVRDDVVSVCHQIAACAHVFASSLHGLIVADAYGVANTWLDPISQSRLKYLDYAASVGRAMPAPVPLDEVAGMMASLPTGPLAYADRITQAQHALRHSFPAPLRATHDMAAA